MKTLALLGGLLFLPLFPFSMVFVRVLDHCRKGLLRLLLILVWPQLGVLLVGLAGDVPSWVLPLAILTSILYAWRALVLKDLFLWIAFLAVSAWSLLWLDPLGGTHASPIGHVYALGFSLGLALLEMLGQMLKRRFGAAYVGLQPGLAQQLPRLSVLLVLVVLAVIATPPFPGFAVMLSLAGAGLKVAPLSALALCLVWLLWTWAAARLLQGLIVGEPRQSAVVEDADVGSLLLIGYLLTLMAAAGLYLIGGLV